MPRPVKCRRICSLPQTNGFVPVEKSAQDSETIHMTVDEYETIRLLDLEQLTQEECAKQMGVARTTVTAIYIEARRKMADVLVNGKRLVIEGGNYFLCENKTTECGRRKVCCKRAKGTCPSE